MNLPRHLRRQIFIGEIDQGFKLTAKGNDRLPPAFGFFAQGAIKLAHGLGVLGGGVGVDNIGNAFGLIKVQFA